MTKLDMAMQLADRDYRYGEHKFIMDWVWQQLRGYMKLPLSEVKRLWEERCDR